MLHSLSTLRGLEAFMATVSHFSERARPAANRLKTEEEALDVARQLAATFAERASERDINRIIPYEEIDLLAQSGLLGITVPDEYGGADVSNAVLAEVIAILSEADGSIGQIPQNHFYILEALRTDGSEEQKKFFFGRALAGDRFGNALSETGTKTVGHYNTRITEDGIGYRINGRKFYSTGVLFAEWVTVFALDDEERLTMSFVPRNTEGLQIIDDWDGFGQRTTASGAVKIENVRVPKSRLLPVAAFDRPTIAGPVSQIIQAAIDAGIARGAIEDTIAFIKTQSRPWIDSGAERAGDDPYTIAAIGDLKIRLHAAEALLDRAGRQLDATIADVNDETIGKAKIAVAEAKVLTTEVALAAANKLFELAGTRSTLGVHNLDRFWRDARTHTLHDPVRWKYHAVGQYYLNGVQPPLHSWI